ncbi:MAG: phosphatase PAP2 family protein [Fodinibius sp.]|nr:phosphatase PAP2 family protein [Fodinibius sp.]
MPASFFFTRERPTHNEGPYDVDFLETGATSFPSGHTATAFAIVTPWLMYYRGRITYTLMAIPVGTAIARVAKGHHWLSDVTAGAGIGFAMGYCLSLKSTCVFNRRVLR